MSDAATFSAVQLKAKYFGGKGQTVCSATYIFQSLSSSQDNTLILELSSRIALLYDTGAGAHRARPLQPAALAFVSYGFVLVRVRVK